MFAQKIFFGLGKIEIHRKCGYKEKTRSVKKKNYYQLKDREKGLKLL